MNLEFQGKENAASDGFIPYCLYFTVKSVKMCYVLSIDLEQTCSTRFHWGQNAQPGNAVESPLASSASPVQILRLQQSGTSNLTIHSQATYEYRA